MNPINFRRARENGSGAIAVETERRLALPCGDIAIGIEQMLAAGQLSNSGYGWVLKDMGDWIRVDLDREALGLPRI